MYQVSDFRTARALLLNYIIVFFRNSSFSELLMYFNTDLNYRSVKLSVFNLDSLEIDKNII